MSTIETAPAWTEPDDAPELTDDWFGKATRRDGDTVIQRGSPAGFLAKRPITLRLDEVVPTHFRATGEAWQTRINDALRRAAGL